MMSASLFNRLGGPVGFTKIVSALVDNHMANPLISKRFSGSDPVSMKKRAADFFAMGSGQCPSVDEDYKLHWSVRVGRA
jgi:hypothetical protein